MSSSKHALLKELQTNIRLRIGLWLIAGILAVYGLLLLDDYRLKLQAQYETTVTRLHQLEQISQQAAWTQRADDIQKLRQSLESKLWQANTQGLAEANLQAWFDKQLKELEITGQRLKINSIVQAQHNNKLWKVTANVNADFIPKQFDGLLFAMANSPQWLVVERVDILARNRNPKFTLIVSAYFRMQDKAATS